MLSRFFVLSSLLLLICLGDYNNGLENEKIFWFVQISDTHFSYFIGQDRITDLKSLCTNVLPIIKPDILLLTGDITDGKREEHFQSGQNLADWKAYYSIFEQTKVQEKIHWFDLRGNHDVFGVLNAEDKQNYFSQYSIQGRTYPYSYMYTHIKSFGKYSFIGMDLTPSPGNKWPLNFFGNVITKVARTLVLFNDKVKGSNTTFWFGHYPTSSVVSPNFDLRRLIGSNGFAYFSGHLHQLMFRHHMYARQKENYLELELADWKDNRAFRIVAVDNDLVSFQDFRLGTNLNKAWPFGIITNPKSSDYLLTNKEPTDRILQSKAIRILAWSDVDVVSVKVYIDNDFIGDAKLKYDAKQALYELPWNPQDYKGNFHTIQVKILDAKDRELLLKHHFSVDGKQSSFIYDTISHILLCFNLENLFQVCIYTIWVLQFFTMVLIRYLTKRNNGQKKCIGKSCCSLGVWRFINNNYIFYGKILELFISVSCPIFAGYFIEGYFGAYFHFGLFLNHKFLPLGFGAVDEFFFFLTYKLPVLLILINELSKRTKLGKDQNTEITSNASTSPDVEVKPERRFLDIVFNTKTVFLFVSLFLLLRFILLTAIPYGVVTLFLSPSRIGIWFFDALLVWYYIPRLKVLYLENVRKD